MDWAGILRRISAQAVDLIFPPVCSGCGRLTGYAHAVCASCWAGMPFIERPYCEVLGLPFAYDPGESAVSPEAIANPPVFDRLRSVAIHEGIVRDLVHGLKYRDRTDLAPMMAEWMIRASDGAVAAADMIVPVPLHALRLWRRKFNQAAELARVIAERSARAYRPDVLRRIKRTSRQVDSVPGHARTMSAAPSQYPKARSGNSRASASFSSTTSIRPARPSPPRPGR